MWPCRIHDKESLYILVESSGTGQNAVLTNHNTGVMARLCVRSNAKKAEKRELGACTYKRKWVGIT